MSSGILSAVSFAKESVWGTAVVPTKSLSVHPGDGLVANRPPGFPTGIKGTLAKNNAGSYKKAASYSGELEVDLIPGYATYLFESAIGSSSPTLVEAGVYKHTMIESATKPSLTVEQAQGEVVQRFAGVMTTGFNISAKTDDPIVVRFPVVAKAVASATAITPAYATGNVLTFLGATLKIAGTNAPNAENIEMEYRNGIEVKHSLNQTIDPSHRFVKGSEGSGSFELYLDATTAAQYTAYLDKTVQSLSLTLTGSSIGASSTEKVFIEHPAVAFTAANVPLNDDINLVRVSYEAQQDAATGKLINVEVTNAIATLS